LNEGKVFAEVTDEVCGEVEWRTCDRLSIDLTIILGQILRYFVNRAPVLCLQLTVRSGSCKQRWAPTLESQSFERAMLMVENLYRPLPYQIILWGMWVNNFLESGRLAIVKGKSKAGIAVYGHHLTATECHWPYGITQCHLPPDTSEHTPPSPQPVRPVLDLPTPEWWKAELT